MNKKSKMKILSIIPARGNSKSIKKKNIALLNGKPLISYTINASLNSKFVTKTIVSTDNSDIAKISKEYGAEIVKRPQNLADSKTTLEPVVEHTLNFLKKTKNYVPDYIAILAPTSPLRTSNDIDSAFDLLFLKKFDSVISGFNLHTFTWKVNDDESISPVNYDPTNRPNRQEIDQHVFENGSMFITKTKLFNNTKCRISGKIGFYQMPLESSFNIDVPKDLSNAETFLKNQNPSLTKNKIIIVTGSEGLLGSKIVNYLEKNNTILKLDIRLGHDLNDEKFVKKWFINNPGDCLINCFAINDHVTSSEKRPTLFDISLKSFSEILQVNLTSLFSTCREFARNNSNGSIINFSASTGLVSPRPDIYDGGHKHVAYSISKAGVVNLTKFLSTHLAPSIRVNCIAPGGASSDQSKSFLKKYSELTPMKRMMNPDELNGIIDYLCSDLSSYTTGSTIVVDGGWTVW